MKNETFSSILRRIRNDSGLSLRDVARAVDIDFTYLSKCETGKYAPPSSGVIKKLAKLYNIDSDLLLSFAGKIDPELHKWLIERPDIIVKLKLEKENRVRFFFSCADLKEKLEAQHLHWRRKSVEHLNAEHHQAYKYAEGVKAGLAIALEELRLLAEAAQEPE